jgi:hypothetical protein
MPIINRQDATEFDQHIEQIFTSPDHERAQAIRKFLV